MKALMKVAPGVGNVEIREIPDPKAGPGQVVIEVAACGICGTDYHIYHDAYKSAPPVVLGHEIAGTIVETGEGANRVKVGDRVTTETFFYYCGQCRFCRTGAPNLCPDRRSIGSFVNGGFARYLLVPERGIHRLPESVDMLSGCMTEPICCNVHGVVERTGIIPGDVVLVSGPGAIGLIAMQLVKANGATAIICGVDGDEARLDLGRQLGADHAVNAQRDDLAGLISELTEGRGVDVAVEAAGAGASLRQCLTLVRKGGAIAQMGLFGKPVEADLTQVALKQLRIVGTFSHIPEVWPRTLKLVSEGKVRARPLITRVAPLTEWRSALDAFASKTECKIVLTPVD